MSTSTVPDPPVSHDIQELDTVTIRFAGDSGDGMQLTGTQFTNTTAIVGNDISTLPDYPAEIRAPAGSLPGVSGFQINFSNRDIRTPGDAPDVLVAMNPAALKVNLPDLVEHGMIIVNTDSLALATSRRPATRSARSRTTRSPASRSSRFRSRRSPIARSRVSASARNSSTGQRTSLRLA